MAVVLENISATTIMARATISAVYQTAKLITSVPNVSYDKKASNLVFLRLRMDFSVCYAVVNCLNCWGNF